MCDDLHATVRELAEKGATFAGDVEARLRAADASWCCPAARGIGLYEPRHQIAADIRS